jgi:chromate transport protein ChrA
MREKRAEARKGAITIMHLEKSETPDIPTPGSKRGSFLEVFATFARLGLTSFGGPVAHLGYFRQEIVVRRKWLEEEEYADLLALCQFLPGPSSSQMGIALGITRAGVKGGLAAWLGFTLPSALALTLFAYAATSLKGFTQSGLLHGLLIVAVAVVAQAVPGPLFTFSASLGAIGRPVPGWPGALIALVAIFLPSFLFVIGILPFWNRLRTIEAFRAILSGVNAAGVGILLAALYQPIWTSAILMIWKWPPWLVVLLSALIGLVLSLL